MHKRFIAKGFTVVELAIVIVVIGILVAITAVSYVRSLNRSAETAAEADLQQASVKYESRKAADGVYPVLHENDFEKTRGDRTYTMGPQLDAFYCVSTTVPQTGKTIRMIGRQIGVTLPAMTGDTTPGLKEGGCPRLS